MRKHSILARDAALAELRRANRWLIASSGYPLHQFDARALTRSRQRSDT